jgi:NAD(P)-dependent dehydrogenase (short-subunit alcohol dehydrogenase family)
MRPETVLITGCSSGIGRATAEAFLDEGWQVYATARNPADVETLGEHANCEIATLDVTDDDDVERVVSRIEEEAGALDCLVNNAGYAQLGPMEDISIEDVHAQFDVNVYGPHRLARAALPLMREEGDGTIVNLSSLAGRLTFPGGGAYSATKFALESMSDAMRVEVEPQGIDVVLVEPGPVRTNFDNRALDEVEDLEHNEAYDWLYKLLGDREVMGGDTPGAVDPDEVAAEILNAASATKPPARVPVGPWATIGVYARYLPDWAYDGAVRLARKFA